MDNSRYGEGGPHAGLKNLRTLIVTEWRHQNFHAFGEMNITPRYERGIRGLIPLGRTN